jgi:hypothetical protein
MRYQYQYDKKQDYEIHKNKVCKKCGTNEFLLEADYPSSAKAWFCGECKKAKLAGLSHLHYFSRFCSRCKLPGRRVSVFIAREPTHIRHGEIRLSKRCIICKHESNVALSVPILKYDHEARSNVSTTHALN